MTLWGAAVGTVAVWFVVTHRADLVATVATLGRLRALPLAAALLASAAAILNRGAIGQTAHRAAGLDPALGSMTRVGNAAYALNKVLRSGGAAGVALFVRQGRAEGSAPGRVVAAMVFAALAGQVALLAVVGSAVAALTLSGRSSPAWMAAAAVFGVGTAACLGTAVWAAHRPLLVRAGYERVLAARSRLRRRRPVPSGTEADSPGTAAADDFHAALQEVRSRPAALGSLAVHSLIAKLLGAVILGASIAATGVHLNVPLALTVYALALVASAVSLLPGGLGTVEASMGALLAGHGLPAPTALAVVLTFRFFDLWLPVAIGALAVRGVRRGWAPAQGKPLVVPAALHTGDQPHRTRRRPGRLSPAAAVAG